MTATSLSAKDVVEGISVATCVRCGYKHDSVTARVLLNPTDHFTHWAMCPVTSQPIMVEFVEVPDERDPTAVCLACGGETGELTCHGDTERRFFCRKRCGAPNWGVPFDESD